MSDITQLAKGQPCLVRLPGICNGNAETTVPAHYSLADISGRSIKSPPTCVAWACFDCHEAVDRRAYKHLDHETVRLAHAEGVFRTLAALHSMGYELVLVDGGRIPKILPRRWCA